MLILRWLKFKPTFNLSKNNCRNLSAKCKFNNNSLPNFNIYMLNSRFYYEKCFSTILQSNTQKQIIKLFLNLPISISHITLIGI